MIKLELHKSLFKAAILLLAIVAVAHVTPSVADDTLGEIKAKSKVERKVKAKKTKSKITEKAAKDFIKDLGDTALMSLTGEGVTRDVREKRIREILNNSFDIKTIARFAMGTHWRVATDVQKQEYLRLFEDMIVVTYTSRFEDYSGQKLEVGNAVKAGKRDVLVTTQIVEEGAPPLTIDWRVRKRKAGLRIIDVVVEGISMGVTQRSDFSAVIQRGGDKVDALLDMLRKRNEEAMLATKQETSKS